ncbi:centromere protein V [Aplysia californica]|uniref:Centromere protein V n=1 Tax=Aplysia californica TaxID=6500 RepID=A0ABM0JHQ5_APLCA|nr:centromere protein V [Aplysia californica]
MSAETELIEHTGGCHCGAVRFRIKAPAEVTVYDCNCSVCTKKQNFHFMVHKSNFELLQGAENITTYRFGTKVAQHTFCKICGVQSFYTPRSNPDCHGVAPHCLDPGTMKSTTVEKFGGDDWEAAFKTSDIQKHSKS